MVHVSLPGMRLMKERSCPARGRTGKTAGARTVDHIRATPSNLSLPRSVNANVVTDDPGVW